ncbi:hypothetical protein [Ekhidna sp.]|uniref:hypothetical protein n=1 Tax=Ekhidna sp. TaxID=2608089 RepID=UPI003C7C8471
MDKFVYKHTLGYLFLFTMLVSFSQKKYVPKATAAQLSLEGKALKGYTTNFDFGWEEVRRGWWEYARAFGAPLNMKTYYKVTVPSQVNDGNVDIEIFTQTTDGNGGSDFFLGVENEKYNEQALAMILDFKKEFYINHMVEQIEKKQEKADDLCDEYRDAVLETRKQELLSQITAIEQEIEGLRQRIKTIELK